MMTISTILEVKDLLASNEEAVRQLRADEAKWGGVLCDHVFQIYDSLVFGSDDWEVDPERIALSQSESNAFKI